MTPDEIAAETATQDLPARVCTAYLVLHDLCEHRHPSGPTLTTGQVSDVDMALMYLRHLGKGLGVSLT